MKISMKPQTITPKFEGTVRQLFFKKIRAAFLSPQFQTDVVKPLKLDDFIDQEVKNLSGGELQRVYGPSITPPIDGCANVCHYV